MACCVLLAGGFAALIALKRLIGRRPTGDPRAWRLPATEKADG